MVTFRGGDNDASGSVVVVVVDINNDAPAVWDNNGGAEKLSYCSGKSSVSVRNTRLGTTVRYRRRSSTPIQDGGLEEDLTNGDVVVGISGVDDRILVFVPLILLLLLVNCG